MLVQCMKALYQVALDRGEWTNGILLWPGEDPIGGETFGGDPGEMRHVHTYRRSLHELRQHLARAPTDGHGNPEQQAADGDGNEQPRGRGRGRQQQQPKGRGRGGRGGENPGPAAEGGAPAQ